jgi:hypothetical protein
MPIYDLKPTIDFYPWPKGLGFNTSAAWWAYVGQQTEEDKLELMLIVASLNQNVRHQLLTHDQTLFTQFQLSLHSIDRLCEIHADCLSEFASALLEDHL